MIADMRTGLLPIGAFARASTLSIVTLRHYHDEGLLVPAWIDPQTGYRYYSAAQLLDAEVIRRLRGLDLPVEEVRTVLTARDPQVTSRVVRRHEAQMAARLREAERIVAELQALVDAPLRLLAGAVEERQIAPRDVLVMSAVVAADQIDALIGDAIASLATVAERHQLTVTGPVGALYPGEEWDPDEVRISVFVPVGGSARPPQRRTLPGGRFAVARHHGPYEQIADTYRSIGVWLARSAADPEYEIRESYLVGPGDGPPPDGYLTEIAWPITESEVSQR
jgi:DNA-binding transcriptional MerR regulator/predicted transcriptional regulator YdeE